MVGAPTDSATEGVDYQEVADFTITIPANQTSGTTNFTLTGIRDAVSDNNETLSISGLATGYKVNSVPNGIGIFEWFSTIELEADVSSVSEHDGATTVTVTAHIHPTVYGNVYVTVSVGGGTATSGTDYAAVSNFTITIPNKASSATGTFTLTPTQDALLESDETININGSGSHWDFYAGRGTSMTLTDAQPITLSANPSSVSEGASGTQVAVTATATGTVATPRTVTVSVGDTGTATSGTDYAAVSDFDITIPANKTGATNTFTLTPTKDSAGEGDETIGVSGSSTGAYVYPTTLTLTDTNPAVTLSASPSSISEGAGATSVTVTATASDVLATARTVTVSVGGSGTATSGTDYAAVSDFTITIAANATSGTGSFTLTPTDDTALEGDETIGVTGTSSEAAAISNTVLTLTDDDLPTIALTTVPAIVKIAEGAGLSSVTVRATAAAAMKAETTVTLAIGAGGDSATKTTDYTTSNVRTITIPKDQSMAEASFELTPVQDTSVEGDEFVSVSGTSSGGHTVTGTFLTLTDDDRYRLTLSASPSSVGEGASATSVTVTATAASAISSARTVTVSVGGSGTATSGTDYAAVSNFDITIAANATSGTGTFTLTPTQDTSVEGNETIGVAGTSSLSRVAGTTVTLTDDDSYPAITLSANPASVSEGANATSVTVTATAASAISSARKVTVSVGGSGTASPGTDYATVADFTVTIAANATSGTGTFTLTPTQDTSVEGSETIGVAGTSPSSTVTGTTVTLTDDDTHAITLSASPSTVPENKASETITVTAAINVARTSATAVTVSVGESGDQATSGTDYEAVSDFTVTIAANATSGTGTFTFKPKTDTAYEGFESVTISGTTSQSGGGGAGGANANASIPVTDTSLSIRDASNYPAVTLSVAPSSVGEEAGATSVTGTATAASAIASSREVTVSVGGSGTAASGTDYAAVSDFIIKIAANATSGTGTFTLTPTDDSTVEGSETIGVAGTSLSTTVTGTTLTLTDNDSATVTINDANAAEGDSLTFTVTLSAAVQGGLTVTPSYTNGTAEDGDYEKKSNPQTLSFTGTANESHTFKVPSTEDAVLEANETFTVGMSVSNAPSGVTATDTGTGTINNDDSAAVTINDASADEGDAMTFTVTLSEAVQDGLTVTPTFTDVSAVEGTDYDENTTALTFTGTKGETKTFTVSTTEEANVEAAETFTVGLTVSNAPTGTTVTATDTGTGTINNDDSSSITINDANASEGDAMTFTVTLSEAVQGGLTVTPSFTDVSAVEGTDYDENTTALSFTGTKGETQDFTVSTTEDVVFEGNETFTVGLSVSGAPSGITATDTGTGTINNDDSAAVAINDTTAAEGDAMTFTVTLSEAVQGGLKVTPSYTDVTATEGTDYDENTAALTFTGTKDETKTFTVSTTQDAVVEGDETFTVGLTVSDAPSGVTDTDTGTGTINSATESNVDTATLTIDDASAAEGGNGITFTVTLSEAVQGGLKVTPSYTHGTTADNDYTKNTTALTFTGTKGETQSFTVSTTKDAVLEANETFTVGMSVSGTTLGDRITSTDTGTGTINNDDSSTITIEDVDENEGDDITFTVTLSEAVQGGLKVTPTFTDGTAVEGTDYDENTTALTFTGTKGETKTFTVDTTQDAVFEADETFTVSLSVSGAPSGVTSSDTGTGTINNDDSAAVTINDASADEGDDITFTVTLSEDVQDGLTVTPGYTHGTTTDNDYTKNTTALSFTGTKGETKTFTVSTTEDAVVEYAETFTVGLTVSKAPAGVTATDTGTGTINNDDSAEVSINVASADEGDAMNFTVTLSEAVQGGLKVKPSYTNGTATSGDYTANTTALSFTGTKGETKTFTVDTTPDGVVESNETFTVGLTVSDAPSGVTVSNAPSGAMATATATATATGTGTGTINNDDSAEVSINIASADEGEAMTFTVTLSEAVQGGLTVTPSYTDVTATQGDDYTANTTVLSFTGTANETQAITVSTTQDALVEGNESFTVSLSVSNAPAGVTDSDTGTGIIFDNDVPPVSAAEVTIGNASATEGDSLTFTVTLDKAVSGGLTVTPTFTNGTAGSSDYTENTTALTFTGTANESHTFMVATTQDALVEGNETFTVGLSVSATTQTVTATDTGTGTIQDNDSVTVSIGNASATEGSSLTFTVTLDKAVSGGLTVTPTYTNGTASSSDYTANTTALSFTGTANETQTFTVSTTQDTLVEGNETFTVGLSVSATTQTVTATDTGIGTIQDNDTAANASVTIGNASATEGSSLTFTVTLDKAVSGGLTVTPTYTNGTASSSDYTANTTALSFTGTANETQTFTVSTTQDALVEGNETFTVGLSVSATTQTVTDTDTGTGTIQDDDTAANASVTIGNASATEGSSLTFTVTLDQAVSGGLTVTPTFTNGTATSSDYTENTTALTFTGTANESHSFTVATTDDAVVEGDETFTVGLSVSATTQTVTATDTGIGTIRDNDTAKVTDTSPTESDSVAVTVSDASATEGNSLTFTVTLDKAVSGGLTVTPTFTNGTATSSDYTENTTALTFTGTAGESHSFTVATTDDALLEPTETFTVSLSVSATTQKVTATDTGIGTIRDNDSAKVTIGNASATEGSSLTFTVTLDKAVSGGLTVTPTFTNGTATQGSDYTENTTALTFTGTAGESHSFTVATTDDVVLEGNEHFTVGLSASHASVTDTDTATGTIQDNDAASVTVSDASTTEGTTLTFAVTLDRAVQGGLTVTPTFTDGTATQGSDYTENTTALTFTGTAGESHSLTVATLADGAVEGHETFTVGLTASHASVTDTDTGTGTILNDDVRPTVAVTGPSTVQNGAFDVSVIFSTSMTGFAPGDLSVGNGSVTGLSGSGASYTATIAPAASGTVTVTVAENVAYDSARNGNQAAVPYSVQADLDAPTVSLSGPQSVKGINSFDVSITFSESVTGFVPGDLSVGNGSVTGFSGSGASYAATIMPAASGTVTVAVAAHVAHDQAGNGNQAAASYSVQVVVPTITSLPNDRAAAANETPTFAGSNQRSVAENTPAGQPIGAPVQATDADGDALTYALSGTDAAAFALDTDSGQVRTKAALDYESRTTYAVVVEVSDDQGGTANQPVTITITDENEPPDAPDAPTVTATSTTSLAIAWTAPSTAGRPPISDYDVQYRLADSGDAFADIGYDGTGTTTALDGLQPDTAYEVQVRAHNDEGTSDWSASGTGRTDANIAPTFATDAEGVDRSVAENTPAGQPIGAPVSATDAEGDALTYTLAGTDAAAFALDADSGQVRTKAALDYETRTTYAVVVEVRDDQGGTANQPVTITITDENEPPDAPDAPTVTATSTTSLAIAWTAPSTAGRPPISDYDVQYRLADSGDAFADIGYDGTGTTTALDGLQPDTAYEVQVRAHNDEGTSDWSASGTGRTDANTAPTFATDAEGVDRRVAENTPAGQPIGAPVSATDSDSDALTYALAGEDADAFALDADSGQVRTKAALDYESRTTYAVVVEVRDDQGGTTRQPVTILVLDENEPPDAPDAPTVTATSSKSLAIAWTAPSTAGRPPISDYDVQYRLANSGDAFIDIGYDGTGTTTALDGLQPDTAYEVQVRAHNDEGTSDWSASGTGRTDANTAPTFATGSEDVDRSVAENTPAGQPIGAPVSATDADGDALTYALAGTDAAAFALDADSGQVRTLAALDYETRTTYAVVVEVRDDQGGTARQPVAIAVTDENEPPDAPDAPTVTATSSKSLAVAWTAPSTAGRPPISDYDVQYRLASSGDAFADIGYDGTGTTTALDGLQPDTAYEVQVRAHNDEGTSDWSASGTGRTDANTAPTFATDVESGDRSVAENTPAGQPIGAPVSATDADGDALTYALAGTDAAAFALDADSGQVRTKAALDYESRTTYAVVVEVRDDQGGTANQPVTITITDENEPPDAPDAPTVTATSSKGLAVAWTAPSTAGRPPISDYDVQYRLADSGDAFADIGYDGTGTTTALDGLQPDTAYEVQVRAHNDEGTSDWSASGTGRTDANTAPTFATGSEDVDRSVAENTPAGQPIGAPVSATDSDGDALTYALSGTDAAAFALDADSGQVRTLAALDYETRTTYAVVVEVSDDQGGTARLSVTITVTDEDEPPDAPDAPTVTATSSKGLAVAWTAPSTAGRPPISDYDVQYRLASSDDAFIDIGYDGTGTTTALDGLQPGTAYEVQIRAHNDEGTSDWSAPGTGRTHENAVPIFADGTDRRSAAENTPAGQPIGAPVSATDAEGDALTYTLAGTDAASFALDADSGQVRTKAALDYESRTTYAVIVEVSDDQGGTARQPVAITVTDEDEPPATPDAPTVTGTSPTSLAVAWTAPATAGRPPISDYDVQYRLADSGNAYTNAGFDGTGTTATLDGLQPDTAYEVQVRAHNDEGTSDWSALGTGTTDKRPLEAPVLEDQTATAGTPFSYQFVAAEPPVDYEATRADGTALPDWLHFDASTRTFRGTPPAAGTLTIEVTATDGPDRSASATFALRVMQVAPVAADDEATVAEGGTVRIDVLANDTDFDGDPLSVHVVEETSHGAVQVNADGTVTYAHDDSETVRDQFRYRVHDGTADSEVATVTIAVGPVNDPPTAEAGADQEVAEEAAVQLNGSGTDPEGEVLTYAWTQVSGPTVALSDATSAAPAFTAPTQLVADEILVFELVVTDASAAASAADAVTITVQAGTNDAPVFDAPSYAFTLAENEAGSSTPIALGRVLATDPEGEAVTYALTAGDASRFALDTTSGELTYIGAGEDAEATEGYTLTAQAVDPHGASTAVSVWVAIGNVDEPGVVTLSTSEPLIGHVVTAQLQDPDGAVANERWQWQHSEDGNFWNAIAGATTDRYTPVIDDDGMRLRATVTYTDPARTTPLALASAATEPVAVAAEDENRTRQLALAAVGRSVAEDVIEALNARMVASRRPESYLTINGQRTVLGRVESGGSKATAHPEATAEQQRHPLDNSEFQLAIDETNELTLWGRGALEHFSGRLDEATALALNGQLGYGYLGVDYRPAGAATGAGMMMLRNQGTLDYRSTILDKDNATLTLTNILPYAHWRPKAGVDVWSLIGYGVGEVELLDVDPVRLRMGAVGLRYELRSLGRVNLAAKTDAFAVQLTPDEGYGSVARRLRLALESRMNWRVAAYASLQPNLELGVRWDGGDAATGPGAEIAGGLTYMDDRYGLNVEARGRRLLAHQEDAIGLWGGSLMVRRQSQDRRGLQVALGPSWGEANSQVESLWRGGQFMAGSASPGESWTPSEMTLTSGYGLGISAASRLTPFVEAGTGRMQRLRVGTRWEWTGEGNRQVELFGEQRSAPGTAPDRGIQIRGTLEL